MSPAQDSAKVINDALLNDLRGVVARLQYGVVALQVQAGKIVQLDVTERKRYDDIWRIEGGSGI